MEVQVMTVGTGIREIGDAGFAAVVAEAEVPVVAVFFATWCGGCHRLAPVLDMMAAKFAGRVDFVKINADENPDTVARYQISSTPTLIMFVAGQPVARLKGAQPEAALDDWFSGAAAAPGAAVDGSWVPVDACTLPTARQPFRLAEFGDLFEASLRGVERLSTVRLRLRIDASAEGRARGLAARESACCSFFTFSFTPAADSVWMDIAVPPARTEVLDGLTAQAAAVVPA